MHRVLLGLIVLATGLTAICLADVDDLSGGVFIAHAPPGIQFSTQPPQGGWCEHYLNDYAIESCEDQVNRIDDGDGSIWYVLAAWNEEKEWCATAFGFSEFDESIFWLHSHGPCYPSGGLEIPTGNWPGPDEGISLTTTDQPWAGNFVPVYQFAGYAYARGVMPLAANPETEFGGWANCSQLEVEAAAYGGMGLFTNGIYACPEGGLDDEILIEDPDAEAVIEQTEDGFWINLGGGPPQVSILETDGSRTVLEVTVGGFHARPVDIDGVLYYEIFLDDESLSWERGLPALPQVRRSLVIPDSLGMSARVIEGTYVDLPEMPIAPSRGILGAGGGADTASYVFDPLYESDGIWPTTLTALGSPFIIRDLRGIVASVTPFQYVPSQQTLRVCMHLKVELVADGPDSLNVLGRTYPLDRMDPQFAELYRDHFLNFTEAVGDLPSEAGKLLVICYDAFLPAIQPLVDWKRQTGLPTELVGLSEILSPPLPDTTAIKQFIAQKYSAGVAHVLLVGDAVEIPHLVAGAFGPFYPQGASDSKYALVSDDDYPDLFIGRFSAECLEHVTTQVDRGIAYEAGVGPEDLWITEASGAARHDDLGGGYTLIDHMEDIRNTLLPPNYSYTLVDQIYYPTGTPQDLSDALNSGRGLLNVATHGCPTHWWFWDSNTIFGVSDVLGLDNSSAWPLVFAHSCGTGHFNGETCLAETFARASIPEGPTGAVASFMNTRGYPIGGAGHLAQRHAAELLAQGDVETLGGLWYGGCWYMLLNGAGWAPDVFKSFVIFGDPTLMVRSQVPQIMTVEHSGVWYSDQTTYELSVVSAAGARCGISIDGILYGFGTTDESGFASVPLDPVPEWPQDLTLTVVAANRVPYAATLHPACVVNPSGTGDFPDIQAAVDAAWSGWVIDLTDGTFTGPGNRGIQCVDKSLALRSQIGDPQLCIIDCESDEDDPHYGIYFNADSEQLTLEGVSIKNGQSTLGGAVHCRGLLEVVNCRFEGNYANSAGAIYVNDSATLRKCVFIENTAGYYGGAVHGGVDGLVMEHCTFGWNEADGGAAVSLMGCGTISGCTLSDNSALDGGVVEVLRSDVSLELQNSIIAFASAGEAVSSVPGASLTADCCDLYGNADGDWTGPLASQLDQNGNMCTDPIFCRTSTPDRPYSLHVSSPCLGPNNPSCGLIGAWGRGCPSVSTVPGQAEATGAALHLGPAVPNPTTGKTLMWLEIPSGSHVSARLAIYDAAGRLIRTLVDAHEVAGRHRIAWEGTNTQCQQVQSGIYFCKLVVDGKGATQRIVLVR